MPLSPFVFPFMRRAVRIEEAPSADEKKYAEMIERRVREAESNRERGQGTNETQY